MARRPWDDLSPDYRRRLERTGVTPADYSRGVALAGARGHRPGEHRAPSRDALARRHGFTDYAAYKRAQDLERAERGRMVPKVHRNPATGRTIRVWRYEIGGSWTEGPIRVADLPRVERMQLVLENGKRPIVRARP